MGTDTSFDPLAWVGTGLGWTMGASFSIDQATGVICAGLGLDLATGVIGAGNSLGDVNQMTYDELLERFGFGTEHQRRGASSETINALPLITLKDDHNEKNVVCNICLEEFQKGDEIRKLPQCQHEFHRQCIDRWLTQVASCPICKQGLPETTPATTSLSSSSSPPTTSANATNPSLSN